MSTEVSHLELRVTSDGYVTAENRFGAAAKSAEVFERALNKLEAQQIRAEKAAERQAAAAARAAAQESERWSNAIQKATARYEREAEAAERTAQRKAAAAEKASARESELWNDQKQKAIARYERQAEAAEKAAAREAAAAQKSAAKAASDKDKREGTSGFGAAGLVVGGAALAGAAVLGREIVNTTREFDRLNAALITATGSSDNAEVAFKRIQKLAMETPFSLQQVTDSFVKLKNYGLNPSERAIRSYGDTASSLGKDMGQMIEAVADAATGEFERLKEFGVLARQKGDDVTLTFRGMSTTVKRDAQEIEEYLIKLGENNFAGAMAERMNTLDGAISNLKDEWSKLMLVISKDGGIGMVIQSTVGMAIDSLNSLGNAIAFITGSDSMEAQLQKIENRRQRREVRGWAGSPSNTDSEWTPKTAAAEDELGRYREDPAKLARERARKELEVVTQAIRTKLEKVEDEYLKEKGIIERGTAENGELRISMMKKLDAKYKKEVAAAQKADAGPKGKQKEFLLRSGNQDAEEKYAEEWGKAKARELESVRQSLARQEDGERKSYEDRKKFLSNYTGKDAADLLAANEVLWDKHNAKLAQQAAEKEAQRKAQHDSTMAVLQSGDEKILAEALTQESEYSKLVANKILTEQEFTQLKVHLHTEANRKIYESNLEHMQQLTQMSGAMFGNLATAAENWGGKTSSVYKGMFAAQKSFAVASTMVAMYQDIAKAESEGGPYAGPIIALSVAGRFAQILSQLSSANYSGAYDEGGRIPAGGIGLVGEYGPEFVRGPAVVTSRVDTARMMSDGERGGGQAPINITVVNSRDGRSNSYRASSAREKVLVADARKNKSAMQRAVGG